VEIIVSEKVANKDLLGIFENSLILSNYENSHKKQLDAEEESEKEEVDKDERTKRVNKKIDNLQITVKAEEEVYNSKSSIF
jgi:leucyl aminopeptidase